MEYGCEMFIQYVELGGVVGVFLKLDAAIMDEHSLETILQSAQQQIRMMVRACREGSIVHRESYAKVSERRSERSRGKMCHCRYCDEIFYCRADLIAHQTRVHPTLPLRVGKKARKPCPTCGRLVINLALHIRTKHRSDPVVNYSSGIAQCRQCEETYPVNTDHASVCRLSPTCPECKKTFSQWRVMNKHRKIVHMGEKMTCGTCNKTYHDAQSLKKHMEAVHLKLKRVCPLCNATVATLAGHMSAVHADVRNFSCTSCDKKFKSNYDLSRHRDAVHLGQKPACPICGKHLSNLNQHIRIVHKQIRFGCSICSKQLNTRSELQKHILKLHGSDAAQQNQFIQHKYTGQDLRGLEQSQEPGLAGVGEETYIQPQRDLIEDQLIAQYLGKQSFSLPSNPLKQEVLTDPIILSKEEEILSKQDLELLGQTRLNMELRPLDIRQPHSDMRLTEIRHSDVRLQELRQPDMRQPDLQQSDMQQLPDMRQPEIIQQDIRQSNLLLPEMRQELRELDMRQPELRELDMRQPELRQLDMRQPELRQLDMRQPEMRQLDMRQPELRQLDMRQPELRQLDMRQPELRLTMDTQRVNDGMHRSHASERNGIGQQQQGRLRCIEEQQERHRLEVEQQERHRLEVEQQERHRLEVEQQERLRRDMEQQERHRLDMEQEGRHRLGLVPEGRHRLDIEQNGRLRLQMELDGRHRLDMGQEGCHRLDLEQEGCHRLDMDQEGCHRLDMEQEGCHRLEMEQEGCHRLEMELVERQRLDMEQEGRHRLGMEQEGRHRLEMKPENRNRLDIEPDRHSMLRVQNHSQQRSMMQTDGKQNHPELDPSLLRTYQPPVLTTVSQLPPWNHPLHTPTK